jgi:MarC family membrane protein
MNPIGNIPIFIATLKNVNPKRHAKIIMREVAIALAILIVFMLFGQYLLNAMQISPQALGISGGIILFLISIRLIFPPEEKNEKPLSEEPFIVPLAIPLTAGPGAMATVMIFASQNTGHVLQSILVPVITCAISCCILLSARYLSKILKTKGLIALERLSGMMLTAMAVQMFLSGLGNYFRLHY